MLAHPDVQRFFLASVALLLGGCAFWSDQTPETPASPATRLGIQLNGISAPMGRFAWLQHQVTAMDAAAFNSQGSGLNLKQSYQLTLLPRKT